MDVLLKIYGVLKSKARRLWKYVDVEKVSLFFSDASGTYALLRSDLLEFLGYHSENVRQSDSETKTVIIECADKTLSHEFNVLGSGWCHIDTLSWQKDIKTGFEWHKEFYQDIRKRTPMGVDIKVPWELSRSHHLLWLGEAYILTSEEKYAKEVVSQIEGWIDDNPLMYTVNWTCSMDVAIRAVNWMYALNFISQSHEITDSFCQKVCKSLFQHGFYIWHNLEKSIPWSNNHYTSDLVGLIFLGHLFRHTHRGRKWKKYAVSEFYNETRKQVLPSGVHYEKSVSYHRLMVELTCFTIAFLQRIGEDVPEDIILLSQKMIDYVRCYTKSNGMTPLLGDNDNGRLLPFVPRDFRDHRYLFNRDCLEWRIVGQNASPQIHETIFQSTELFEDAGIAVIRNKEAYLFVSNCGYSRYVNLKKPNIGTHTHNDALSFEFSIGNDDLIVDPGSYVYTSDPARRNEFRSTAKHNTIMVDDEEQNILHETRMFSVRRNSDCRELKTEGGLCVGKYVTIDRKMEHQRSFCLERNELVIKDKISEKGENHHANAYFHFAEGLDVRKNEDNRLSIITSSYKIEMFFRLRENPKEANLLIIRDTLSPSYGKLHPSKTAVLSFEFDNECEVETIISWKKK